MAYQYDVFISYRCTDEPPVQTFPERSFRNIFEGLLNEKLQPEGVRIFYDRHDVRTGKKWPETLHQGLAHSKILVPILIPSYFHREWCLREYAIFHHRELQSDMGDDGLIFPVNFYGLEHFPKYVTGSTQLFNFTEYNYGYSEKTRQRIGYSEKPSSTSLKMYSMASAKYLIGTQFGKMTGILSRKNGLFL